MLHTSAPSVDPATEAPAEIPTTETPTPETPAAGSPAGESSTAVPNGHLRLTSVLASGLPAEVGTPDEPRRYTVPAVFSRQVGPREKAYLEDPSTARRLAADGHPGVELRVSDRRLLIGNTTLAELRDGLASRIAAVLREMGDAMAQEQTRLDDERSERLVHEQERAAAVTALAADIRFD
ncbi:hypothetical protein [Cellulomonas carbonis]|uniref:Uncharacterized protein n=1 Tax=Cellulomonas carbonis T26 TaxID=947969 RepID=A0A0A0BN07_9CELL|nr:hypothetical protein [Cellulomonas carbonis]KGM09077.1 hypothetical protein N868_04515 [Cellulomonas carbonis T26]